MPVGSAHQAGSHDKSDDLLSCVRTEWQLMFLRRGNRFPTPTAGPQIVYNDSRPRRLVILKQACLEEYQEAQDAFKDSMIH